ncbi:MAG: VOC family protein [Eubacteriaceae bacterium]
MNNFLWCTIHVKDMEQSIKFYEEIVGLTIDRRYPAGPGREIVFLGEGSTKVELIYDKAHQTEDKFGDISLGFEVKSAEEKVEFLKQKGIKLHTDIFSPNPTIKFFFIKDPDGLNIQFVENIK